MKKLLIISLAITTSFALAIKPTSTHLISLPGSQRTVAVSPVKLSSPLIEMQRIRSLHLGKLATRSVAGNLPSEVDLGMNGVPVLFQGDYPTCVTFAVTVALDAALNKGDYISQLCLLQLSNTVAANSFWHNLWDGSSNTILLNYISHYGIMTTSDQQKGYCNNVKIFPTTFDKKYMKHKLSVSAYHAHSEDIYRNYRIEPQALFQFAHTYSIDGGSDWILTLGNNSDGWITPEESFAAMRKSLAEGNRVVLEFLFKGNLGRGGMVNVDNDTWFASNELRSAFGSQQYSGEANDWYTHDVVIYGYNDEVTVQNAAGETQTGVFYLRNSWGEEKLEYMSYDFFKLMSIEGISINTMKSTH
jgi:C1A family cysteine protease